MKHMYYVRFVSLSSALNIGTLTIPRLISEQNYFPHLTACIWNDTNFGKAYGMTNAT